MRFLFGLGIGFVVAMLFAPARGEEMRERLMDKARDLAEEPQRKMQAKAEEVARRVQAKAGDVGSEVGRRVAEAAVQAVKDETLTDKGKKTAKGKKPA